MMCPMRRQERVMMAWRHARGLRHFGRSSPPSLRPGLLRVWGGTALGARMMGAPSRAHLRLDMPNAPARARDHGMAPRARTKLPTPLPPPLALGFTPKGLAKCLQGFTGFTSWVIPKPTKPDQGWHLASLVCRACAATCLLPSQAPGGGLGGVVGGEVDPKLPTTHTSIVFFRAAPSLI